MVDCHSRNFDLALPPSGARQCRAFPVYPSHPIYPFVTVHRSISLAASACRCHPYSYETELMGSCKLSPSFHAFVEACASRGADRLLFLQWGRGGGPRTTYENWEYYNTSRTTRHDARCQVSALCLSGLFRPIGLWFASSDIRENHHVSLFDILLFWKTEL